MRRALLASAVLVASLWLLPASAPPRAPSAAPPGGPAAAQATAGRQAVGLEADWRFRLGDPPGAQAPRGSDPAGAQEPGFDDRAWDAVRIPHTWNRLDGEDGGNNYHRGPGWYRRHVAAPQGWAGRRLWLEFDGANAVTDVWVNGAHLGQHRGGYARFRFDATVALRPGHDNVLAVRVSNAHDPDVPPLDADFTFFGGLYRAARLLVTDPVAVDLLDSGGPGVYVRQRGPDRVEVTTRIRNSGPTRRQVDVRTALAPGPAAASTVATVEPGAVVTVVQALDIPGPRLWRGRADPFLYRADVRVRDAASGAALDAVSERFGLRTVSISPTAGLSLNGEHVALHGVNRHQDRLGKGWAVSDADHTQDFDLMDEMGVNALRTAHYQQAQKVYDLADERGYLVWTEIPLVNAVTATPAFTANAEQQLRELIRQNYNHPSVVFWGIGNEQHVDDAPTNTLLAGLARLVAEEDPDRLSAYAHDSAVIDAGLTTHTDVTGYNRYFGWYYGQPDQLGGFLDNLHRAQPKRRIALSEYGAGAGVTQHQENPPRPEPGGAWHPEEYQALFHERYWAQIQARPYLWGTFVWNMFDFAADWRGEGDTSGRNDKGLVTYDRSVRKDAFYWYKANWTQAAFVHITSGRWADRTLATTSVKVYGTADSVTLKVNGVAVGGPRALTGHAYTWPGVTLAPGPNTIEVTGTRGGVQFADTVRWTLQ